MRSFSKDQNIFIISRSSGGRVASLIEDEPIIKKIICLSYPFKHPEKDEEPLRTKHLEYIQKPLLIIQGYKDAYGGKEVLEKYRLSPSISLSFLDTDHEFRLSESEWKDTVKKIKEFIEV
jgi:predicted alpha/beta-hydrolase family hydrolase